MKGNFVALGVSWSMDMQVAKPDTQHVVLHSASVALEAIVTGQAAYFRGQQFLAAHVGQDPTTQALVAAAGNSWWKGSAGFVPSMRDLTTGAAFRASFLGAAAQRRTDHVSMDGMQAVELSGPRADVYIADAPPYRLLRLAMRPGAQIDGLRSADLRYVSYDADFRIQAPAFVIDFSNLSTLPPVYTVVSVDATGCGTPCSVSAVIKNIGGLQPSQGPSTITFTMTDPLSSQVLGSCQTVVAPDVGYNSTTSVSCQISLSGPPPNAATVTAAATNLGPAAPS